MGPVSRQTMVGEVEGPGCSCSHWLMREPCAEQQRTRLLPASPHPTHLRPLHLQV